MGTIAESVRCTQVYIRIQSQLPASAQFQSVSVYTSVSFQAYIHEPSCVYVYLRTGIHIILARASFGPTCRGKKVGEVVTQRCLQWGERQTDRQTAAAAAHCLPFSLCLCVYVYIYVYAGIYMYAHRMGLYHSETRMTGVGSDVTCLKNV